ncbi:hypothetical protein ACJX0J_034969, partial [Zea mays]
VEIYFIIVYIYEICIYGPKDITSTYNNTTDNNTKLTLTHLYKGAVWLAHISVVVSTMHSYLHNFTQFICFFFFFSLFGEKRMKQDLMLNWNYTTSTHIFAGLHVYMAIDPEISFSLVIIEMIHSFNP